MAVIVEPHCKYLRLHILNQYNVRAVALLLAVSVGTHIIFQYYNEVITNSMFFGGMSDNSPNNYDLEVWIIIFSVHNSVQSAMLLSHDHGRFYARQHIRYSAYMPCQFRPSVRLSVTRVYCIKTAERIIEILSLSDRSIILVFRHQGSLRKSDGFTPNRGSKYKGGSNFRPICGYISETV